MSAISSAASAACLKAECTCSRRWRHPGEEGGAIGLLQTPRRGAPLVATVDGGRLADMRSASPGDSGRSSRSPGASRPSTRASSASAGRAVAVPVSPDVPEKGEATGASTPARRAHERILRPPALPLISWHPAKRIRTGDASSSSPYEAPLNTLKHLSSILEACAARPETSKRRPAHTSPPSVHRPLHDLRNWPTRGRCSTRHPRPRPLAAPRGRCCCWWPSSSSSRRARSSCEASRSCRTSAPRRHCTT